MRKITILREEQTDDPEKTIQILEIDGQEYRRLWYDWYIDKALFLAPASWNYDDIISLRFAIRENYQHLHNFELDDHQNNDNKLRQFIQTIEHLEKCL